MIKIQMPNATQAQQAYAHAHVVAHAQQQAAQQAREHRERQVRHLFSQLSRKLERFVKGHIHEKCRAQSPLHFECL